MNGYAPTAGNKSDDLFTRQRMAAQRKADEYIVDPFDSYTQAAFLG